MRLTQEKTSFYYSVKEHFTIDEYKTDTPKSMPNFHYHNKYEIYYLKSGERYYFIKDNTYAVKKGSFVLIDKNDIHCTGTLNNSPYERILLYFDDYFLKNILDAEGRGDLLAVFKNNLGSVELSPKGKETAEAILTSVADAFSEGDAESELYIKSALIQLLCLISKEAKSNIKKVNAPLGAKEGITARVIGYINNNYSEDITLELLSEMFFISPCHLSRTFKSISGISFVDYLNNVRIKEAKKLLINTKMSITEICSAVGYKNNTHFGRIFKKITSFSPITYRKRHLPL